MRRVCIAGLALCSAVGCSGTDVARPPPATALNALNEVVSALTAPCPGFGAAEAAHEPRDDLFVEAGLFDVPSSMASQLSLQTLSNLPRNAPLHLVATPHLIGKFDQRSEMALGSNGEANEQSSLVRWSVLPHRADEAVVLELELELAPPTSEHHSIASPRLLKFSMTAHENQPVLARTVWDEASHRSLVLLLRVFEIRNEQDLRAIFQCMMQQHAAAVSRAKADPR